MLRPLPSLFVEAMPGPSASAELHPKYFSIRSFCSSSKQPGCDCEPPPYSEPPLGHLQVKLPGLTHGTIFTASPSPSGALVAGVARLEMNNLPVRASESPFHGSVPQTQ